MLIINKFAFGSNAKKPSDDMTKLRNVAVHEAGHALVALKLAPDCFFGASILPQGESCGHIQFINPDEGVGTVSEIENEVAVLLGGHIAERVVLGEYLTGADSDMRGAVGRIHYLTVTQAAYGYAGATLGTNMRLSETISEKLKESVCDTVLKKLNDIDSKVEKLISENIELHSKIVSALMKRQTLSRDELFEIKNAAEIKSAA